MEPGRTSCSNESDDHALSLLVLLETSGPIAVQDLMRRIDLCESDVNGLLSELRAAGLIERVSIGAVPGYACAERGSALLRERAGERDPE